MFLPPTGSEYYDQTIITVPQLTNWEASFDDGTTWIPAVTDPNDNTHYRWLLKGPNCPQADGSATLISAETQPLIRAIGNPEVIIRKPSLISLTTPSA